MKKRWIITGLIMVGMMSLSSLQAQMTEARVVPSRDSVLIGDQPEIRIEMNVLSGSKVWWPEFVGDTVTTGIEILDRGKVDTLDHDKGYMTLRQTLKVTSFDSGLYVIEPIPFEFIPPGDTTTFRIQSEPAYLVVTMPDVDMEADIKPIKPPLEAPVTFAEVLPWILLAIAIAVITFIVVYVITQTRKDRPALKIRTRTSVPPHIQALDELEKLRQMKLWQSGRVKEYYTHLTEIIRWYIEERYNIAALEMTTGEIYDSIRAIGVNETASSRLHDTLELADLVKFAKEQPLPVENDISLNHCIDFVRETKPQPEAEKQKTEEIKEKEEA